MKLQHPNPLLLLSLVTLSITFSIPTTTATTTSTTETQTPILPNANHIFNALSSALRQWGSSWNHNGMSLFRATVPVDVLLYHGRGDQKAVTGMEWLAFEPEHAMMFARRRGPPPGHGGKDGGRGGPGRDWGKSEEGEGMKKDEEERYCEHEIHGEQHVFTGTDEDQPEPLSPFEHPELRRRGSHKHKPVEDNEDQNKHEDDTGYLNHYRTLHDLNLLYIDGLSAGKTSKGTLDIQDYLLLGNNSTVSDNPFGEVERAVGLCNLTRTIWNGKVDGFIRMESGFEMLLCEFEGNVGLDRVQAVRTGWHHGNETEMRGFLVEGNFRMYRAVSDRFWGIGENRAEVSFQDFVTAYSREDSVLFEEVEQTGEMMPRLRNVSDGVLNDLKDQVTRMVQRPIEKDTVDWQKVSDMYVQRYAAPLQALPNLEMKDFRRQLELLLWVFASDNVGDAMTKGVSTVAEVSERCVNQFLPRGWNSSLAGRAVHGVGSRLCGTLANLLFNVTDIEADSENDKLDRYAMARQEIWRLVSWLDWSIWRFCSPGCAANEVCVLPVWPISSRIEDRKRPNCQNATMLSDRTDRGLNDSYWYSPGDRNGPPGSAPAPPRGKPPKGRRGPRSLA